VASWHLRETAGLAATVAEDPAVSATHRLVARTGLDICPEGGAAFTAFEALETRGAITAAERVVLFNTGTGLKYR
jgi:threonine synthase